MRRSLFILSILTLFIFAGQAAAQSDTVIIYDQNTTGQFENASAMIGSTAVDRNGENLGMIEDVIFSETGEASYLVITPSDTTGEQVVPVPFAVADPQRTVDGDFVIDVDRRTLASAPAFTRNEVNDYANADLWENEVRGYFGVEQASSDRAISDRQEFRDADIDATIESSKESGGLTGTHTGFRQDDMSGDQPRAYFEDRYEADMDATIESSKESGGLTGTHTGFRDDMRDERVDRPRAYFGDDRYEADIDSAIESSKESGGLTGTHTGFRDDTREPRAYRGPSTEY